MGTLNDIFFSRDLSTLVSRRPYEKLLRVRWTGLTDTETPSTYPRRARECPFFKHFNVQSLFLFILLNSVEESLHQDFETLYCHMRWFKL